MSRRFFFLLLVRARDVYPTAATYENILSCYERIYRIHLFCLKHTCHSCALDQIAVSTFSIARVSGACCELARLVLQEAHIHHPVHSEFQYQVLERCATIAGIENTF